jgi:hypothetical protein
MDSWRSNSREGSSALALLLLPVILACAGALPALAICPLNEFYFHSVAEPLDVATFDTTLGTAQGNPVREAYDQTAGTIHVYHPGSLSAVWFKLFDDFDVAGLPSGTQVPVTVEVSVAGWIATGGCGGTGCWGFVETKVGTPTDSQAGIFEPNIFGPEQRPFAYVVTAAAVLQVGTPTPISIQLAAGRAPGGSHYSSADAIYRFRGLPPGAVVMSCRGYSDPATPVRPASWGRIKAVYR